MATTGLVSDGKRVLLAVAAPAEADAVAKAFGLPGGFPEWRLCTLSERFDLVVTGVGKAAAAGGVGRVLDAGLHGLVLSVGIAGTLSARAVIGSVVVADRCDLADDGIGTDDGFLSLESRGFGPFPGGLSGLAVPAGVVVALRPLGEVFGPVATVSVCSGTDALAARLTAAGYVAEAMEGAALGLVAARVGVPFGELRVISNTTGERSKQRWELKPSLARLAEVLGRLRQM